MLRSFTFPANSNFNNMPERICFTPCIARELLISCAELVFRADFVAAHRLISILSSNCSPYGDSNERLIYQFTKALMIRIARRYSAGVGFHRLPVAGVEHSEDDIQSSYLCLNQVTPFIRFSHLTANQAILEATEGQKMIHIIDFDIMHGVQWPPMMQALAERHPSPTLRITGTGGDIEILRRTGDRLSKFAHSLGLKFHFNPILLPAGEDPISAISSTRQDETVAVNFNHYLRRLHNSDDHLQHFLRRIKSMGPTIITVAEKEPIFRHGGTFNFIQTFTHYSAVFDSLEATLPPHSRERLAVEQIWYGREITEEIVAAVAAPAGGERFRSWDSIMGMSGLRNVAVSKFAVSQAKLLLRLHYPSEGYQLHVVNHDKFLCLSWGKHQLFTVSSWR